MTAVSLGDLARTFLLRRQNAALKEQAQSLSTEVVTGQAADVRKQVGGDLGALAGIDRSLATLTARKSLTSEAGLAAAAMQTALGAIDLASRDLALDIKSLGTNGSTMTIDQLGSQSDGAFRAAISALNTRVGDRSIFAGDLPQEPAMADAETILADLDLAVAGATTAADVEAAVSAWFDGAGYATAGYKGGDPQGPMAVGATETAQIRITANDPTIRETLKGLALGAILERGPWSGTATERADLASRAGDRLLQNQSARIALAADLGLQEARIESAAATNAAEITSLQIARTNLLGIDSYEAATMLESTQTQIETLYSLTSRLSRLSLVDYL